MKPLKKSHNPAKWFVFYRVLFDIQNFFQFNNGLRRMP